MDGSRNADTGLRVSKVRGKSNWRADSSGRWQRGMRDCWLAFLKLPRCGRLIRDFCRVGFHICAPSSTTYHRDSYLYEAKFGSSPVGGNIRKFPRDDCRVECSRVAHVSARAIKSTVMGITVCPRDITPLRGESVNASITTLLRSGIRHFADSTARMDRVQGLARVIILSAQKPLAPDSIQNR